MVRALLVVLGIALASIVNAQQRQPKNSDPTIKINSVDTNKIPFYEDPVEIQPRFPGGIEEFHRYLSHNLHYPPEAVKHKTQGKVFVVFVIERDGHLTHLKVMRGVSKELDAEALRVVRNSPKWIPGTINGKPSRYEFSLPVNFSLNKK